MADNLYFKIIWGFGYTIYNLTFIPVQAWTDCAFCMDGNLTFGGGCMTLGTTLGVVLTTLGTWTVGVGGGGGEVTTLRASRFFTSTWTSVCQKKERKGLSDAANPAATI